MYRECSPMVNEWLKFLVKAGKFGTKPVHGANGRKNQAMPVSRWLERFLV